MQYLGRTPCAPLDRYIERIWYCSDLPQHSEERVLPGGGTLDLIVNLFDDRIEIPSLDDPASLRTHSGAIVSGVFTRSYRVDPRQRAAVLGVHFYPGGAFPFLGISPSEVVDTHVELRDLWGVAGRNLREQLLEAGPPSAQLRSLETLLLSRLKRARAGHSAVRVAVSALRTANNAARITEISKLVGLSHRRFIELFEREVGLTPKLYARLQRFHRVKQRIARLHSAPSWASFALECGYFDQSHMIRDFVAFSGMSPASYLRGRSQETMFDHAIHAYR
jgi:AraC-like DNA-binding protein